MSYFEMDPALEYDYEDTQRFMGQQALEREAETQKLLNEEIEYGD